MSAGNRQRLLVHLLSSTDPFEIDAGNYPHLLKHGFSLADLWDLWDSDWTCFPSPHGEADWLMVGRVEGDVYLNAPLAPSSRGRFDQCRPIGLYRASRTLTLEYTEIRLQDGDDDG